MFPKPVQTVVVCSYGSPVQALGRPPSQPARLVLTGTHARALVDSLENAPTRAATVHCPMIATQSERELAMLGIGADGHRVALVTANLTEPACNVTATNGTAIRYNWQPPDSLRTVLTTLTPRVGTSSGTPSGGGVGSVNPGGPNQGSPIHT
jgi:hypothetical protein